jgi:hypothetical protein
MKQKQVLRSIIHSLLREVLSEQGFRYARKHEGFERKRATGSQLIVSLLSRPVSPFEFTLVAAVRIEEAEKIYHRILGTPSRDRSLSMTTGIRLEYFVGRRTTPLRIETEEDVRSLFEQRLNDILVKKIIPFLDAHQDVGRLDELLNGPDGSCDIHCHPWRGMSAIIVAHLAANEAFPALVKKYRKEMRRLAPSLREQYERVVEYIETQRDTRPAASPPALKAKVRKRSRRK